MFELLTGAPPYREEDAENYLRRGWWSGLALGDLLDRAAGVHPDKEAFVDRLTRLTYAEAREKADRLAVAFLKLGVKPLDRVMVQLPNWIEFVPAYFALQKIGAIPVMLIDRYRLQEVQRLAEISEATTWIVPVQYGKVEYLPTIKDVLAAVPGIERVITVRGELREEGFLSLERLLAEAEPTPRSTRNSRPRTSLASPRWLPMPARSVTWAPLAEPRVPPRWCAGPTIAFTRV